MNNQELEMSTEGLILKSQIKSEGLQIREDDFMLDEAKKKLEENKISGSLHKMKSMMKKVNDVGTIEPNSPISRRSKSIPIKVDDLIRRSSSDGLFDKKKKSDGSATRSISLALSEGKIKENQQAMISLQEKKRKKDLRAQIEIAQWVTYQKQIHYAPDVTEQFLSTKDVLKKRVQFNKQAQEEKEKIKKNRINIEDFDKYKINTVSFQKVTKLAFKDKDLLQVREDQHEKKGPTLKELYKESIMNLKDPRSFFVHGKTVRFSKTSLGLLENKSKLRWYLVWLTTSKGFEYFIIFLIMLNSVFLGIKDYTDVDNTTKINIFVESAEPFFTYIFLAECVVKIIAQGFILGRDSYLTEGWNWLDFVVVVTSLLQQLPEMKNMSGLRTFRLFRPLKSLTTMPSMKLLIGTLFNSVKQLGGIMGLAMFFFMIFAILGVSLWDGRIHYRCYQTEWPIPNTNGTWNLVPGDIDLCSEGVRECPTGTFCNSRFMAFEKGLLDIDSDLRRDSSIPNLNFGITNFDNIGNAFLTIFQCITMEGWTKIMNIYEDAYASWFVNIYFILCVVICSFFLLNLTIAVMLMKYEELEKNQTHSKHHEELKQIGMSIELPPSLTEFLIKQDSIQIQGGANKMLKGEESFIRQLFMPKKTIVNVKDKYYKMRIVSFCYNVIFNQYFEAFIFFVIILNTFTLSLDKYPVLSDEMLDFTNIMNLIFTCIFTAEVVIKIIGLGPREFVKEKFNQFDTFIVIISLVQLQFQEDDGPSIFSSLRAFRLFKLFRLFRAGDLRILLDSITFTLSTISDYTILLMLFIFVFALMGMSFFAGKVRFNPETGFVDHENGVSPRTHFDTLEWSFITIFQVLMGESWNQIMYNCMRSVSPIAAVYFIALVITGNIIMLNLFLAILLGNFDKARNFQQKKKVFEAFKEIKFGGKMLNEALDMILGEMSFHVKTKILKWDYQEVIKLHSEGDTKIAQGLVEDGATFYVENQTQRSEMTIQDAQSTFRNELYNDRINRIRFDEKALKRKGELNEDVPEESKKIGVVEEEKKKKKKVVKIDTKVLNEEQSQDPKSPGKLSLKASKSKSEKFKKNGTIDKENANVGTQDLSQNQMNLKVRGASKTIEKFHRLNKRLLRVKEFNQQIQFNPYPGLREIIEKKNFDQWLKEIKLREKKKQLLESNKLQKTQKEVDQRNSQSVNIIIDKIAQTKKDSNTLESLDLRDEKLPKLDTLQSPEPKIKSSSNHLDVKLDKTKSMEMARSQANEKQNNKLSVQLQKKRHKSMKLNLYQKNLDLEPENLESESTEEDEIKPSLWERFNVHRQAASLFIFHRDGKVRKFCMQLTESPEILKEYKNFMQQGFTADYKREQENKKRSGMFSSGKKTQSTDERNPSKIFENWSLVLIIMSSIMLAVDNPLKDPKSDMMIIVSRIDFAFTCMFTIEAAIKIIAKGFNFNNMGPIEPYIKSYWNMIDFFVVCAALLDIVFLLAQVDFEQLKALKALRALRALRPLRMISRNEGMRLVVNALLASLPSMSNVLLVCSLFILIFSIGGVNFFKGTFYKCLVDYSNYPIVELDLDKIVTMQDCLDQGGLWKNSDSNFDNCIEAMSTLFQMTTTEGWTDVMYDGIDNAGVGMQPKNNNNMWYVIYFIAFMIIGSQFIINLFVGVVIDNFNTIKEREELGNMFVTDHQRSYIEIQKVGQAKQLKRKIKEPKGCRKFFFMLVNHSYFTYTITFFIIFNTIVMAIKHYQMSNELIEFTENINYLFTFIFNVEMILKLIGLGWIYFHDNWNIFDMLIVFSSDIGIIMDQLNLGQKFTSTMTIFRAFRIMRMFKLIRSSPHMRLILDTVFNILPQVTNVMSLIVLLFFIYAALGINLFSGIMLQDALDRKNNFQTFGGAMIVLMKFSTGEDWNRYMYELANMKGFNGKECKDFQNFEELEKEKLQCGTNMSYPFFISFTIIVTMLIMNLSVAAVIEGLNTAKNENMGVVHGDEIERLIDYWQEYDNDATGWITLQDLVFLLYELPPPLGKRSARIDGDIHMSEANNEGGSGAVVRHMDRYLVHKDNKIIMKKRDALELLSDLKIKVHADPQKQIYFVDVFKALIKRLFVEKNLEYKLSENLNKKIKSNWDKKHKSTSKKNISDFNAQQQQAGQIIVKWARKILSKNKDNFQKEIKSYKAQKKINSNQNKAKPSQKQKVGTELFKEQAKIIFNIINEKPTDDGLLNLNKDSNYKIKNEYLWKHKGGDKLLNKWNNGESSSEEQSQSDTHSEFGSKEESVDGIDLFDPSAFNVNKNSDDNLTSRDEDSEEIAGKQKVHIDVFELDTNIPNAQSKEVFKMRATGELVRDIELQKKARRALENQQASQIDSTIDVDKYNDISRFRENALSKHIDDEDLNYGDIQKKLQSPFKEKLKSQEMKEESMKLQQIQKNTRTCDDGGNKETITFDIRMLDDKSYADLMRQRKEAIKDYDDDKIQDLMLEEDFELANSRLNVKTGTNLDLFTTDKNAKYQNKVESSGNKLRKQIKQSKNKK